MIRAVTSSGARIKTFRELQHKATAECTEEERCERFEVGLPEESYEHESVYAGEKPITRRTGAAHFKKLQQVGGYVDLAEGEDGLVKSFTMDEAGTGEWTFADGRGVTMN